MLKYVVVCGLVVFAVVLGQLPRACGRLKKQTVIEKRKRSDKNNFSKILNALYRSVFREKALIYSANCRILMNHKIELLILNGPCDEKQKQDVAKNIAFYAITTNE